MILRGGAEEAAAPKYAHIERERRWLVDAARCPLPPDFVLIEDRYIDGTRLRLRRMTDSVSGRIVHKLTKKYECADPAARPIVTVYLTAAEYAVFAALPGRCLAKRRHAVEGYSVDTFKGDLAPLMLAEIEAVDDATLQAVTAPAWAMREVTVEAEFEGGRLMAQSTADVPDSPAVVIASP